MTEARESVGEREPIQIEYVIEERNRYISG